MNAIHESWKQLMSSVDKNFEEDEFDMESMEFAFIFGVNAMFRIMRYIHYGGKKKRTADQIQRALARLETELEECKEAGIIEPILQESRQRH